LTLKKSLALRFANGEKPVSGNSRNEKVKDCLLPGPLKKIGLLRKKSIDKIAVIES
jgi:hypothetical protein